MFRGHTPGKNGDDTAHSEDRSLTKRETVSNILNIVETQILVYSFLFALFNFIHKPLMTDCVLFILSACICVYAYMNACTKISNVVCAYILSKFQKRCTHGYLTDLNKVLFKILWNQKQYSQMQYYIICNKRVFQQDHLTQQYIMLCIP